MIWTKHHILYPLLGIVVLAAGISWFRAHDAWKDFQHQAQVESLSVQHVKEIAAIRAQETSALQALASRPATIQTVTKLLPIPLPGTIATQVVEGKPTLTISGDPQKNLQAIQEMEVQCAQCKIDLRAETATNTELNTQINALKKQQGDLLKLAVPRWSLTMGVSKDPGTSFQTPGSYQPGALVGYRLGQRWGITAGVVNKSLFTGVTINLGDTPRLK